MTTLKKLVKKLLGKTGRAAIYSLAVAVLAVAGILGLVTADQEATWSASLASLLASLAPILALFNLTDDEEE